MTKNKWYPLPPVALSSPVFTLAVGQNGIWAGGTGGIAWYPTHTRENDALHKNEQSNETTPSWQTRIATLPLSLVTALTYKDGLLLAGGIEGIACSRDEGMHWQQAALEDGVSSITAFALSPEFASDQTAVASTMENGILRTHDGGRTWKNASLGLDNFEVTALAWSSGSMILAATSDGIYRSSNAGRAWRRVYADEELGIDTITHFSAQELVATLENGGLLRSSDGGAHWLVDESILQDVQILSMLTASINGRDVLFAGTFEKGLLRSTDQGKSWEAVYHDSVLSLAVNGTILYAGTNNGISMSDDAGQTWSDLPCPPIHDLRHLFVYKGQPFLKGTYAGILHFTGSAWEAIPDLPQALTATALTPDGNLLISSPEGLMLLKSEEASQANKARSYSQKMLVEGQAGQVNLIAFRQQSSSWQAWAVSEDGTRLLRSDDEGSTWQSLQPPFGILPLVALQPISQRLIAATYDPRQYHVCIWSSTDDGATWERSIEADTQWPLVAAYADPPLMTINNIILLQDATGQWKKLSVGDDGGMIRRVVSIRRDKDDIELIALTTTGIQRSNDWGVTWQQEHEDLPIDQIIDIATNDTDLYVLLTGGNVWRRRL